MAGIVKKSVARVKNNPISSVAGAVGGFYLAKKLGLTSTWYYTVGAVVFGAFVASGASSYIRSITNEPRERILD